MTPADADPSSAGLAGLLAVVVGLRASEPDDQQKCLSVDPPHPAGKATAYHDGVLGVRRYHLESYTEPKRVRAGSISPANPDGELVVIVREGEGAIGLKDALTAQERARGGITFRYTKLYPGERSMLDRDPDLALLPARLEHRSQSGTDPGAG